MAHNEDFFYEVAMKLVLEAGLVKILMKKKLKNHWENKKIKCEKLINCKLNSHKKRNEFFFFFYNQVLRSSIVGSKTIKEKQGDWDLVTEYDRKIEDIIVGKLKQEFPSHKWVNPSIYYYL